MKDSGKFESSYVGKFEETKEKNETRKWGQYLAALSVTMSTFSLGNSLAWSSPAGSPMKNGTYIEGTLVTQEEEAWVGALMPLGAAVCAFPIGFLMDAIGRRLSLLLLIIPLALGWGLVTWPVNLEMVYAGRFLQGLAGGAVGVAVPVYTAEIAEVSIRGALGTYFEMMLVMGIVFIYAVGSAVSLFHLSLICMVVPFLFVIVFFFMPETPLYLISKGRDKDARKSLLFLRGPNADLEPELEELRQRVGGADTKVSLLKGMSTKPALYGLVICLGLMVFQQLSGVDAVTFYTNNIFIAAGSNLEPNISSTIVGTCECIATFLSSLVVDRLGRRLLLSVSAAVMALCTFLLGGYFYFKEVGQDVDSFGWLPLGSLCLYITAFAMGLGPIPWTMVGEVFPPNIQGAASGIASCLNWTLGFIVTRFYDSMVQAVGASTTFWLFAGTLLAGLFFCVFVVKETKGKTAQEIQKELGAT